MKEYNPYTIGLVVKDCPVHVDGICTVRPIRCPKHNGDKDVSFPTDCPAREGILIKVKK